MNPIDSIDLAIAALRRQVANLEASNRLAANRRNSHETAFQRRARMLREERKRAHELAIQTMGALRQTIIDATDRADLKARRALVAA